ncbi:WD40 repeat-like protein [Acaromyces ingoldii]|uniref:Ribosome biogenesis protein YTM1 n=1 Tax=Acaromyces ingoldii TaxID=215250 RepID=A0A316Z0L1_9BASI|nr:WD40 repeat-like protein [Acaromyces ingoldii]PWN93635.1 WD40 repeat-like protein [Acaromyces ingoldii]
MATTTATINGGADGSVRQLPIVLRTTQPTLSIPAVPYLVPTNWRRSQLSTLVNRLLHHGQDDAATIPFDFIVDGQLLRTSLGEWLLQKGLTEENTVDVYYVRSTLPPKFSAAFEHDDWISSVDASRDGLFLTSAYDGALRVYGTSAASDALLTHHPNPAPTKDAFSNPALASTCWVKSASTSGDLFAASAGMDGRLRISSLSLPSDEASTSSASILSVSTPFAGANPSPMSSVRASKSGTKVLTAGWDGCVALWDVDAKTTVAGEEDEDDEEDERGAKRRKGAALTKKTASSITGPPVPATNCRVSGAVFSPESDEVVFSAGWGGAVKQWDAVEGRSTSAKSSDKVIISMDLMAGNAQSLVLTGHVDRSAALWDMRNDTTNIAIAFNSAHALPISSVRAHPTSANLFATASHDGLVKLFDLRSPKAALFSISRPAAEGLGSQKAKKLLALDWTNDGQTIVAGGEDKKLSVHRGEGIGREDAAL